MKKTLAFLAITSSMLFTCISCGNDNSTPSFTYKSLVDAIANAGEKVIKDEPISDSYFCKTGIDVDSSEVSYYEETYSASVSIVYRFILPIKDSHSTSYTFMDMTETLGRYDYIGMTEVDFNYQSGGVIKYTYFDGSQQLKEELEQDLPEIVSDVIKNFNQYIAATYKTTLVQAGVLANEF